MALVAIARSEEGRLETLGVARAIADPDNTCAEFAVLVRTDLQGRGLGKALLARLMRYCGARGIMRLNGEILAINRRMLALCKSLGLAVECTPADHGIVRVSVSLEDLGACRVAAGSAID
jgi:acetyltransferase